MRIIMKKVAIGILISIIYGISPVQTQAGWFQEQYTNIKKFAAKHPKTILAYNIGIAAVLLSLANTPETPDLIKTAIPSLQQLDIHNTLYSAALIPIITSKLVIHSALFLLHYSKPIIKTWIGLETLKCLYTGTPIFPKTPVANKAPTANKNPNEYLYKSKKTPIKTGNFSSESAVAQKGFREKWKTRRPFTDI